LPRKPYIPGSRLEIGSQEKGFDLLRQWREAVNLDAINPLSMEKPMLDLRESQPTGPPSTPEEVDSFLKERVREVKREKQNRIAIREAVGDRPPVVGFTEENPAVANTASAPSVPMDPRRLLWYQMLMREQEKRKRLLGEAAR
jgi:hypothetical protein